MEWGFEVGPSPSAAVLHPSGSIPNHSSCHLHTCSTYSVYSLICYSATVFRDNHLFEKLLPKLVHEPWEQCSMNAIMRRCPEVWKILCYELGVLVLSSARRWWKAVFSVWRLWKGTSSASRMCSSWCCRLQAYGIGVQICCLQRHYKCSLLSGSTVT